MTSRLVLVVLLVASVVSAAPVEVVFEVNDALIKDRVLAGVEVTVRAPGEDGPAASGATGADGRFAASLEPGVYRVAYRLAGYVPYTGEGTEVRSDGQVITVSLSPLLEATGTTARQVRVILNWGSDPDQVKDADSHLACVCGDPSGHVYYGAKVHEAADHRVELDVDDVDWGGPETVTLTDPPTGRYLYWVHDYSAGPGTLGSSDVVVRVLIGDDEAGQFRVFPGVTQRAWRPFAAIDVAADGTASVVRFTEDEIAEGRDLEVPEELQPAEPPATETPLPGEAPAIPARLTWALLIGVALLVLLVRRKLRRRR